MKRIFFLTSLLCFCIATSNVCSAAALSTASNIVVEAPADNTALNKKQLKKQAKQQRKSERRAKFMAWFAKSSSGDNTVLAAVLAFFLGGLGIHRVYMGSKPILILGYFFTFGGIFGLIPLIDFIRILVGGTDHYQDEGGLFRCFQ